MDNFPKEKFLELNTLPLIKVFGCVLSQTVTDIDYMF